VWVKISSKCNQKHKVRNRGAELLSWTLYSDQSRTVLQSVPQGVHIGDSVQEGSPKYREPGKNNQGPDSYTRDLSEKD